MSEPDLFKTLGPAPEVWAHEFARRFSIINVKGEFVDTEQVVLAWFCSVRAKALEAEHERILAGLNVIERTPGHG